MDYQPIQQRCAFPSCTNSFPKLKSRKKYCSNCCRVKDFNRRKKHPENAFLIPVIPEETKPSIMESASLSALNAMSHQTENAQPEPKKGMSLAGVGESAIGTAGMLLLKDQLFDKNHRNQLQQQMTQLLQQQVLISRQLQELKQNMDQLSKAKADSTWTEKLLL